jgi:type IV pilus assembly protein PilC
MGTTYFYQARTPEGAQISGSMLAESNADVVAHLRTRALFITAIAQADSFSGRIASVRAHGSVSPPPLVTFYRSFATLIRAGVSVSRALAVTITQCPDARLRESLQALLAEIEQGRSLSCAMRSRPREFASLYTAMVEAGEAGGMLDEALERLASMLEKDLAMSKKVAAALAYPLIVLCAAVGLIFFLLATIVPTFGQLFAQLNVEQPASTRALLFVGNIVREPFFLIAMLSSAVVIPPLLAIARRDRDIACSIDAWILRAPLFGALQRKSIVARLGRTLGSLLRSGVDVLRAVDVCAPVMGNAAYAKALRDLHGSLRNGDTIADHLQRNHLFEPMVLQMLRVGEETGTLDAMLLKIAEYYESDVAAMTATLGSTLEPLLIILVGSVVGFIVYSVFVPMYSLVSNIR